MKQLKTSNFKEGSIIKIIDYDFNFVRLAHSYFKIKTCSDKKLFGYDACYTIEEMCNYIKEKIPLNLITELGHFPLYNFPKDFWHYIRGNLFLILGQSTVKLPHRYFKFISANNKEKLLYHLYGIGIYNEI